MPRILLLAPDARAEGWDGSAASAWLNGPDPTSMEGSSSDIAKSKSAASNGFASSEALKMARARETSCGAVPWAGAVFGEIDTFFGTRGLRGVLYNQIPVRGITPPGRLSAQ